jgi:RND family efflux transporter MFP subunit
MYSRAVRSGFFVAWLACSCVPGAAEVQKAEQDERTAVEAMTVQGGSLSRRGSYSGFVEHRVAVSIQAEVAGQVRTVPVEEGSTVHTGDLLLALDDEPFQLAAAQAEQALEAAKVRLDQARQNVEIQTRAHQANVQQAEAGVARARAVAEMVEKGARPEEKRQIKASLDMADVHLANASMEYARLQSLHEANAATRQQLDGAKSVLDGALAAREQANQGYRLVSRGAREEDKDSARAGVRQAEAVLESAKAGQTGVALLEAEVKAAEVQVEMARIGLDNARFNWRRAKVLSPVDGLAVVDARYVEVGDIAAPGRPLFRLVDTSLPNLVLGIPSRDIAYVKVGMTVEVTCLGDSPGRTRRGTVRYIPVSADLQNTTFAVKVQLPNEDGSLRGGQLCEASLDLEGFSCPLVHRDDVLDTMEGKSLMTVDAEGRAREVSVRLAVVRRGIACVSEGVEAGTRVIVVGERLAADGELVNVVKEHPPIQVTP